MTKYLCEVCGFDCEKRHCKVCCDNCGHRRDCTDLELDENDLVESYLSEDFHTMASLIEKGEISGNQNI